MDGFRPPREGGSLSTRILAATVAGLAIVLLAWFLISLFQPFAGGGEGRVQVLVPRGSSVGHIGNLLEKRGVVKCSFFFNSRATVSGRRGDL